MEFKKLDEPTFFLASPGDVGGTRAAIKAMFEDLYRQRSHGGIELYAWESETPDSGLDQWQPAVEQIPLPSDPFCKIVVALFGERIGTPMINAQAYSHHLGDKERLRPPDSKFHLELNWESGLEKDGGFPLTGTVFELLVTLAANEEAKKFKRAILPFKIFLVGDETILSAIQSDNMDPAEARWGNREFFVKGREALRPGTLGRWEEDYLSQIRQLRNFIRYLIRRDVHIDEYSIVRNHDEAKEKCKVFLERLGYIEKTGNPFKGLKFYDFDDERIFFGREGWLKETLKKIYKGWSPTSAPFYGIVGGSGVGKSSLLRAGVLAHLKKKGYKVAIYQANDFSSRRGNEAVLNGFSDSPLGVIVKRALTEILEKLITDGSTDDGERPTAKLEDSDKKAIAQIIGDLTYTTTEQQPHKAVEKIKAALDNHAKRESPASPDEPRLIIGLDQFEEILDYRTSENEDIKHKLDSLFKFFQEACKSGRIGFVYTCQNNRLSMLVADAGLASLVDSERQDEVAFPTKYELAEMIRQMFLHVDMTLSDSIVHLIWQHVDGFAKEIEKIRPQAVSNEETKATLLPVLSLTLLNFYEHFEKRRPELLKKQQDARRKPMTAFADSVGRETEAAASLDGVEAEKGGTLRTDSDNEKMLFLELADLSPNILNVENAIKEQAEKALKAVQESPGENWSEEVLGALLRRLVRIHSDLDEHYNLLPIAIPRRGAGKILVQKFQDNRLLIPVGYGEVRLVHEAVLVHWNEAKEWLEKEKQLLKVYKDKIPLIHFWESSNRSSLVFQAVNIEELASLAGEFLRKWWDVFKPNDGTMPSPKDQQLCDFAFAVLEAAMTPSAIAKGYDHEASHFLTAVVYGKNELIRRYLEIEPTAAREHRTTKGNNAVYAASFCDDTSTLDIVIENGASPAVSNNDGWQAIHIAAQYGAIEILDRLVQEKVDPTTPGNSGQTSLHLAAMGDRQNMVRHLLETYRIDPNLQNAEGWTALHYACHNASTEVAQTLLKHESVDTSLTTKNGWSALNIASRNGNADIARLLLRNAATNPTEIVNGWSPLQLAVLAKSPDIVRALLEDERIDREVITLTSTKKSIVEYAIDEAGHEVLKALLDDPFRQVNPDATGGTGDTPLFKACADEKTELVRILLNGGADVNAIKSSGRSPFHLAAERGNVKILKLLLPKADLAQRSNEGRTALHLAALSGYTPAVQTLLSYIDPGVRDNFGATPLHLAAEAGFLKTVEAILQFNRESLKAADGLGRLLPHIAATYGHIRFLSEMGEEFDANVRDAQGMNAVHHAARFGKADFLERLLERADVEFDAKDNYGWTPLHLAAQNGHTAVVNILLKRGADKSILGVNPPLTPLLAAVAAGQMSVIDLLIPKGAEREEYLPLLDQALFLAVNNAQFETASMLLSLRSDDEIGSDYQQTIADALAKHWKQQVEDGQAVSALQIRMADQLEHLGCSLPFDKDLSHISTLSGQEAEGDNKGPTTLRGDNLHNYKWRGVEPQRKASLLTELNLVDGKYQLSEVTTQVDICDLDWYENYRLLRFTDPGWENHKLKLYYLIGPESDLYRLNGTSPPIHEVNAKAPIKLNEENVLSYLIFFCFFVRGEEGPFYVLESMDDPMVEEFKNIPLDNRLRETVFTVIEGTISPAQFVGVNAEGHYLCEAVIVYSNAIFVANFSVQSTGMIEMLEDEPIAADMPFRIDAPIARTVNE